MIDEKVLCELKEFTNIKQIKEITEKIEQSTDNKEIAQLIEKLQEINNTIYDKTGFNTVTLDFQVYINQLRQEYDVTDPREIVHVDNGKGFVQ